MTMRPPPPDQAQRERAIASRGENLLVDASAGTGKTTLLVRRLIGMVAPIDGADAIPIGRIAAITFTRKAAGELRLRIREQLLSRLATAARASPDEQNLRDALAGLDTAYVGTIHSFADRLLRLHPAQARLSPSYTVADDDEALIQETCEMLLSAAQSGTLRAELARTPWADRADEVAETVLIALETGLRAETKFWDNGAAWLGLDALVAGFVRQRDIRPPDLAPLAPDLGAFRRAADEFVALADLAQGESEGARWVAHAAAVLRGLLDVADPIALRRELHWLSRSFPDVLARDTEKGAWATYKAWRDDLGARVSAPLDRWLATRLVRVFPVAEELCRRVKRRRQKLDQLDLLMSLRDLLLDREVRGQCQRRLDHVFVDEFQDTDPLQAEIVLWLCEREPRAACFQDVELFPGKLTLVGDPKQSIYRFRRADVAVYDQVRQIVKRGGALEVQLTASFRSVPPLIEWVNDRFDRVLGRSPDGAPFSADDGRVFHQPLVPYRAGEPAPAVHVLDLRLAAGAKELDGPYRELEARALSRYLRWLVEQSGIKVEDKAEGKARPVRYGDVAVLALATTTLAPLFPALDRQGIPHASRGGRLFLADALIRRQALALRAVSDPDDGVAEAALLAPPFFALTPDDLWRERVARRAGIEPTGDGARRARRARAWLGELRRRRHARSPGETARDLLDATAFGRVLAQGDNGEQRLARARELCMRLELCCAAEGLDFDAATARLRGWAEAPVEMDPPHPVGTQALQILTVHQAKGLEFPVVVIWDGRAKWERPAERPAWRMARDRHGWIMELAGLKWAEPDEGLLEIEQSYQEWERKRVVYVAATRARDLLVVPRAGKLKDKYLFRDLIDEAPSPLVRWMETFCADAEPSWSIGLAEPTPIQWPVQDRERDIQEAWTAAAAQAKSPRLRPMSVTGAAHSHVDEAASLPARREGRLGPTFGETVHQAIGLTLQGAKVRDAVAAAAQRAGLVDHQEEACADVERAIGAIRSAGLLGEGMTLRVEYPLAGAVEGTLLSGYADLVAMGGGEIVVLDFKTDAPPEDPVHDTLPRYVEQVRGYGRLIAAAGICAGLKVRLGLLFTADGEIRWV